MFSSSVRLRVIGMVAALGSAAGAGGQPLEGSGEPPFRLSEAQPPAAAAGD